MRCLKCRRETHDVSPHMTRDKNGKHQMKAMCGTRGCGAMKCKYVSMPGSHHHPLAHYKRKGRGVLQDAGRYAEEQLLPLVASAASKARGYLGGRIAKRKKAAARGRRKGGLIPNGSIPDGSSLGSDMDYRAHGGRIRGGRKRGRKGRGFFDDLVGGLGHAADTATRFIPLAEKLGAFA